VAVIDGRSVLAVVPARSGSKGIPGKNLRTLKGVSLIGRAGQTLAAVPLVDRRIISTDTEEYAAEGRRHGLEAPFLRPAELATDQAGAMETVRHALLAVEAIDGRRYDIVLIVEPTSPLRVPADIEATVRTLLDTSADSAVTVSPLPTKAHPAKVLVKKPDGALDFFLEEGRGVTARQSLEGLYWRNGVCYALTRACLVEQGAIFGRRTVAHVIDRPLVNIDEPWELEWAELLLP
jgi:CMP-N,N'-diacetyllegionaminic acid synthase